MRTMETRSHPFCECCRTEFKQEYRGNMSTIIAITKDNHFCFSLCLICYKDIVAAMSNEIIKLRKTVGAHTTT